MLIEKSMKFEFLFNLFFSFQKSRLQLKILSSIVISFTKCKCNFREANPKKKGAKYSTNKENLCIWVSQSVFSCYRKVLQKVSFRRRSVKGEKKIVGRILPPTQIHTYTTLRDMHKFVGKSISVGFDCWIEPKYCKITF